MELKGEIYLIGETQEVGSNGFKKRELVLITEKDGNYPQHVSIEFVKDNCAKLDSFIEGDSVKVAINIRGRKYEKRDGSGEGFFNSIQGWKIEEA